MGDDVFCDLPPGTVAIIPVVVIAKVRHPHPGFIGLRIIVYPTRVIVHHASRVVQDDEDVRRDFLERIDVRVVPVQRTIGN